jgi:hypothetical protein
MSFYLKLGPDFYQLDATTSISVTRPGSLSANPMHSKVTQSDHYREDQWTMTIDGIVSDVKSAGGQDNKGTADYIDGLERAMHNGASFSVKYRLDKEEEPNWFITSLNTNQDEEHGFGAERPGRDGTTSKIIQSFKVSMTLARAIIPREVVAEVSVPQAFIDALQSPGTRSTTTASFDSNNREERLKSEEVKEAIREVDAKAAFFDPFSRRYLDPTLTEQN